MGSNDCCCGCMNMQQGTLGIGIASLVIAFLSLIGSVWKYVELQDLDERYQFVLNLMDYAKLKERVENQQIAYGVSIGIALVCGIVAIFLILAAQRRTYSLCLPYMIWTIIYQVIIGICGALLIFFVAVGLSHARNEKEFDDVVKVFVWPLVVVIIMFILYTWWLIVVFAFYRLLKGGHAFDSIPMQVA